MLVVMGPSFQVSIARLYAAAILPGLLLSFLYLAYTLGRTWLRPHLGPPLPAEELNVSKGFILKELIVGFLPPTFLIILTLGAIITGWATPTEGAALGCLGAILITAANGQLSFTVLKDAAYRTAQTTAMVMILLAASTFLGSVFSAFGTPKFLADTILSWNIPPGLLIVSVLAICFLLGWPLEWVPIVVIIVPIFLPLLQALQVDMIWFSILVAVTLQTCWLSPPVALSAYYLKAVVPGWDLWQIYRGMMPFMLLQWGCVLLIYFVPDIALYLPNLWYKLGGRASGGTLETRPVQPAGGADGRKRAAVDPSGRCRTAPLERAHGPDGDDARVRGLSALAHRQSMLEPDQGVRDRCRGDRSAAECHGHSPASGILCQPQARHAAAGARHHAGR
jgi:TRAP-type mannitol/chloroaromatic compound transport system permease large subunit